MNSFQRDISINLTRSGDDIVVTNTLKDRFHDILLEVVVDFATLVIKDIRVEHHQSPSQHCYLIQTKLKELIGTPVSKGLTKKIMEVTGGSQGCINLRNVLLSSLPLALNLKAGEGMADSQKLLEKIAQELQGTCIGYSAAPQ